MSFPIEILEYNNTLEAILNEIHKYNPKILHKIRISYLYNIETIRLLQNIFREIKRKGTFPSRDIRRFNKTSPEDLLRYFKIMEYTLSQLKCLLLFYLIIENIGQPLNTLRDIMSELPLYNRSGTNAVKARHNVIDSLYLPPSRAIIYLLGKSSRNSIILEEILQCSEREVPNFLRRLGIEDSIHSLSMGNRKLYCFLLLNGFKSKEIDDFSNSLGVRIEGSMKKEKIQNIIHHTNIGPDLIIEHMSLDTLKNERAYFVKAFNLNEGLRSEVLKQAVISAMKKWNIAMSYEFKIDSNYLRLEHIAEDGHICDSEWERNVDNFLTQHGIKHCKPRSAKYNKYYTNSHMYPDWVIENKMVELFGAEHQSGYIEKIKLKQRTNNRPLVPISCEDYENGKWQEILLKEFKEGI